MQAARPSASHPGLHTPFVVSLEIVDCSAATSSRSRPTSKNTRPSVPHNLQRPFVSQRPVTYSNTDTRHQVPLVSRWSFTATYLRWPYRYFHSRNPSVRAAAHHELLPADHNHSRCCPGAPVRAANKTKSLRLRGRGRQTNTTTVSMAAFVLAHDGIIRLWSHNRMYRHLLQDL